MFIDETSNMKNVNMFSIRLRSQIIIIDYNSRNGLSCSSELINMWKDGSNAQLGQLKGLNDCKNECSKHTECAGFTHDRSTDICGNWHLGQVSAEANGKINFEENKECYSKHDRKCPVESKLTLIDFFV